MRTASVSSKRIQRLSSSTNAGSAICRVLAATTWASIVSIAASSWRISSWTPRPVPARSSSISVSADTGWPSNSPRVHCRSKMAVNRSDATARVGSSRTLSAPPAAGSKVASALHPCASAACTRFSVAHPSDTKRWWSSGSTAGHRRDRSGRTEMAFSCRTKGQRRHGGHTVSRKVPPVNDGHVLLSCIGADAAAILCRSASCIAGKAAHTTGCMSRHIMDVPQGGASLGTSPHNSTDTHEGVRQSVCCLTLRKRKDARPQPWVSDIPVSTQRLGSSNNGP